MPTIYNFNSGPATLPVAVMRKAQAELLNWQGTGISVMEISHRSNQFLSMIQEAEQDLRELLSIPDNYQLLFLPGGATYQFAQVPLNMLGKNKQADYADTGIWSQKAIAEAQRYGDINIVISGDKKKFTAIPAQSEWRLNPKAAYLHYVANETISGVEFHWIPNSGDVPLISDMSSNLLSVPIDINKFGLIYAGAQKNIGISGITLVIVRDDLLGNALPFTPTLLNYQVQANNHSMYNTPPAFAIYIAGLVFKWLKNQGGLAEIAKKNKYKAAILYEYIDQSGFYYNDINTNCRSRMNVTFRLREMNLEGKFLQAAEQAGLLGLRGHRLHGGMRASIYNAMPLAGVYKLIEFMTAFVKRNY